MRLAGRPIIGCYFNMTFQNLTEFRKLKSGGGGASTSENEKVGEQEHRSVEGLWWFVEVSCLGRERTEVLTLFRMGIEDLHIRTTRWFEAAFGRQEGEELWGGGISCRTMHR